MSSLTLPSSSPLFSQSKGLKSLSSSARFASTVCCSRNYDSIPKLKPFSKTMADRLLDRVLDARPLIEKTENELADYCMTHDNDDGDENYRCWSAYMELRRLEEEVPKEDVERMIKGAVGIKSLIGNILSTAPSLRENKNNGVGSGSGSGSAKPLSDEEESRKPFPVPDGLPKSQEELEEEEKWKMPDSPHTRLLRVMGKYPAWYTPRPDHETD